MKSPLWPLSLNKTYDLTRIEHEVEHFIFLLLVTPWATVAIACRRSTLCLLLMIAASFL